MLEALRYGVSGYVLKGAATTELIAAVHAAVAGKRFLNATLAERALDTYVQRAATEPRSLDRYDLLTNREREVPQLAAQGLSSSPIGDRLAISRRTIETHRTNLLRKLGLTSQTDLVRFAIGRGLLPDGG
ncbi:MAG: response regulator transcription factor [Thermomicrobiales bacterium]